jgi:hypothetical protein
VLTPWAAVRLLRDIGWSWGLWETRTMDVSPAFSSSEELAEAARFRAIMRAGERLARELRDWLRSIGARPEHDGFTVPDWEFPAELDRLEPAPHASFEIRPDGGWWGYLDWQGIRRECGHLTRHFLPWGEPYDSTPWKATVRLLTSLPCDECAGERIYL